MKSEEMLNNEVGPDGFLTGYEILDVAVPARLRRELNWRGDTVGMKLMESGHGSFSRMSNGEWEFMGRRLPSLANAVSAARALRDDGKNRNQLPE